MLEVEPTSQRRRMATGSCRNGKEADAGATSEAFAKWLHHRYARVELPSAGHGGVSFCHTILCLSSVYRVPSVL